MIHLLLERPLLSIDVEATGPKPETDRVIELGIVRLAPDGQQTVRRWRINPGCPIPPDSTGVHGITDAMVVDEPLFERVAAEIAAELSGVDLTGYNVRGFDLPILRQEFARAEVPWPCSDAKVIDTFFIFKERERYTLGNAVRRYCGRAHENAHSAVSDAEAALDVLRGQLAYYADLPRSVDELDRASGGRQPDWATELGHLRWRADGDLYVAFGRNEGNRLIDMDDGFLSWVLRSDFPADVKALMREVRHGGRPRAPGAPPLPEDNDSWLTSDDPDDHSGNDDIPF